MNIIWIGWKVGSCKSSALHKKLLLHRPLLLLSLQSAIKSVLLNRIYSYSPEMSSPDSQQRIIFKRVCLSLLVLFLTLNGNNKIAVHGSSSGSPLQACADMVPAHHVEAQIGASPFLTTPSVTSTGNDSTITLTLASISSGIAFKGFLIMGFNNANHTEGPIGSFSSISDGQIINCPGGSPMNAATHSNSDNKTFVTVDWTAPAQFVGTVLFKTTYAQNGGIFWVATPSVPVIFV